MLVAANSLSLEKNKAIPAIFWGGFIAGSLDLFYAFAFSAARGGSPVRVLQAVASGILGPNSFKGGLASAALGLPLHFLIAFGAAAVYHAASRKLTFLLQRAILCGLLYGIAIYLFMQLIVLPLSAAPKFKTSVLSVVLGVIVHMFCIGLPVSLAARRYST
jgi:hypothetical protein